MRRRTSVIVAILVAALLVGIVAGLLFSGSPSTPGSGSKVLQVVAAENFWGSLVSQLGGTHVSVLSIVSDPNADPHEYETNSANAIAVAKANYVIVNGAGYDVWCLHLISASSSPGQKVLNVGTLLGQGVGSNPHFWYSPYYVNMTVHQMYLDLVSLDTADASYFAQQYASLNVSLGA